MKLWPIFNHSVSSITQNFHWISFKKISCKICQLMATEQQPPFGVSIGEPQNAQRIFPENQYDCVHGLCVVHVKLTTLAGGFVRLISSRFAVLTVHFYLCVRMRAFHRVVSLAFKLNKIIFFFVVFFLFHSILLFSLVRCLATPPTGQRYTHKHSQCYTCACVCLYTQHEPDAV